MGKKLQVLDEFHEMEAMLSQFEYSTDAKRYQEASWLKSEFNSAIWKIEVGVSFELDWQVLLADGTLLTTHEELWETLRSWVIARTHVDSTGGRLYSPAFTYQNIRHVLHCIDYFLLRADSLRLTTNGFAGVSSNDIRAMLSTISSSNSIKTSIYQWPDRLTEYFRKRVAGLPSDAIFQARLLQPDLEVLHDEAERITKLNDSEIILARAYLVLNKEYRYAKDEYRLCPNVANIVGTLYSSTLIGKTLPFSIPLELCLGRYHSVTTEYPRASVSSEGNNVIGTRIFKTYLAPIATLALLRDDGLKVPDFDINEMQNFTRNLKTKDEGRFKTLPQSVVFGAFKKAVEFTIEFGDCLVDSYLAIAKAAHLSDRNMSSFSGEIDITEYLTEKCKTLGVVRWAIEANNAGFSGGPPLLNSAEWYQQLRKNTGLFQALQVLYGAIQLVIGLVMARRVGELIDLIAGECLDLNETHLIFKNRKSGYLGLNSREARPIPPICVRFIKMLERLQVGLIEIGALKVKTNLFSTPKTYGPVGLSSLTPSSYYMSMDYFCDWAETEVNSEGKRYYIRQHQLRRFFAMLFFWGSSFGGLETLRWFLGHTNVEHLWHYITESTPGVTIRSVAAEWVTYQVKHATAEAEALSEEIAEHFGTNDFTVLEEDALNLYVEDLLEEGKLIVEPLFCDGGKRYRIAIILRHQNEQ